MLGGSFDFETVITEHAPNTLCLSYVYTFFYRNKQRYVISFMAPYITSDLE